MTRNASLVSTATVAIFAVALLAACAGTPAQRMAGDSTPPGGDGADPSTTEPAGGRGADAADDPDLPVDGVPGPALPPAANDSALVVEPEPGIVNARPYAWDRLVIAPDGRSLTVYYWGGVEECYGLAAVRAEADDDGLLHVTVFEGQRGNLGRDVACIEIALLKSVTVELDKPLVAPVQ